MTVPKHPVGVAPVARPPVPQDIGTARQLWWGVVAFGLVQLAAGFFVAYGQREELRRQALEQMKTGDAAAAADLALLSGFVFLGLGGAMISGLVLVVIHLFERGEQWARTVLNILGGWLVFTAVNTLFTISAMTGLASLVAGGASIVQSVLAGGAIYLSHRPDSTAYFLMNRR
ncbi:hypothetical protein ACTD5D_05670 [Nocardia takedensis]|uniref:hypothetical protein n=1 Tax=Nocardia takedensis TaxID=259390 RepID=UPI000593608A|nr:hypothetical protein [Nocardia takedensis]